MKTIKSRFILLLLIGFVLASCGNNREKQIAKTWQVTDVRTTTELADSVKLQMMAGSQMVFTKDGKYTSSGGIGADQGTYTMDKNGKSLSTVSEAGKSNSVYTIDKLTDKDLVLTSNGNTVVCTAIK